MNEEPILDGTRVSLRRLGADLAVMRLANPPRGYMDDASDRELGAALDAIDADAGIRVVIVTGGQPDVFVRHYDVAVIERNARAMAARGMRFDPGRPVPEAPVHRNYRRIETSDRIFIAAINGFAMGGGFELALACDLRIAQDGDYRIGLPEANIALLPGAGGTQRMTRLVGPGRALEWILLGRTFGPREAAANGLVNECCAGSALERSVALAGELVRRHPLALAHVKRLVRGAAAADPQAGHAEERTLFCDLVVSERTIADLAAFNAGDRPITDPP